MGILEFLGVAISAIVTCYKTIERAYREYKEGKNAYASATV